MLVTDGFVGDASDFLLEELIGELGERGEVKVGKEDKARTEEDVLLLDGLFDLDDHFGVVPDFGCIAGDFGSSGLVFVVSECGEFAGVGFDEDFVPGGGEFLCSGGGDADAALVVFDFPGYSDDHDCLSVPVSGWRCGGICLPLMRVAQEANRQAYLICHAASGSEDGNRCRNIDRGADTALI